jgi:phosphatidylinositol alpha-1,6-mannosyltransferase
MRCIVARRPRLVISDHAHLGVLPWAARSLTGCRVISFVYHAELPTLGPVRRHALSRSDLIIAISEFAAKEAHRVLGAECPLAICPLGLPPDYVEWTDGAHLTPPFLSERRVILIVGRMADSTRDKGHEALIRAMSGVAQRTPSALLVIVGRGGDELRLRQLTRQLGLDQHVHFAGFVPDAELPAYYEAAEIFAMPSFAEGFGLVYLEAMYHGKPCIAGSRDASAEVIADGKTGLLVEPGNVAQIEIALLRLLENPEFARTLGIAGRARLDKNFTYEQFGNRLGKLLSRFLPEGHNLAQSSHHVSQPERITVS